MELAKIMQNQANDFFIGTVKGFLDNKYVVVNETGHVLHVKRSASCLLEPKNENQVLCFANESNTYILTVLEKNENETSNLHFDGDVSMSIPKGKFDLLAQNGISLVTPKHLSLLAVQLGISSDTLNAVFQQIDILGDQVTTNWKDIKVTAKTIKTVVQSAVQQYGSKHTKIQNIESKSAGALRYTIKEIMTLSSKFAFLKADKNLKVDGKQIFLG